MNLLVSRRCRCWCLLWILGILGASALAEEEGQYRSRVELVPGDGESRGRVLSVEELEQQIDGIEDAYARSSAGQYLARHYVEQKDYDRAIAYYRTALDAGGLSAVANREMLRELARLYLHIGDHAAAADTLEGALQIDLVPAVADFLLLAQARYRLGDYVAVVAALDRIGAAGLRPDTSQLRQALALYYRAGAWSQCEALLRELIEREPDDAGSWHQLAAVYLQQNKRRQALDLLSLAREKALPFAESDLLLLVDLKAVNGNPYGAGETLAAALQGGAVEASGAHYRKLFELWFLAREKERAQAALSKAARLSGDTELYLYLAQLQMEQEAWSGMYRTLMDACASQLPDRYVGRANLLLGVSQLKLGDRAGARRSLINATLIGGANRQAAQWLDFMAAEPATEDELRRIEGPCYGSEDKRRRATVLAVDTDAVTDAGTGDLGTATAAGDFQFKELPSQRLFYSEHETTLEELAPQIRGLATRMGVSLVKAGGSVDGPLQIISRDGAEPAVLQLALPVRGLPQARGRYRVRTSEPSRVAYRVIRGEGDALREAGLEFARSLERAGVQLTGERRLVFPAGGGSGGELEIELQLGVAP